MYYYTLRVTCVCLGEGGGITIEGCFLFIIIAYILLVSSEINPGLKGGLWCWRLQMVGGYATQEVEGGVPLLVSSTEALRNHR